MTQKKFCEAARIDPGLFSNLLRGNKLVNADQLDKMIEAAQAEHIDIIDILEEAARNLEDFGRRNPLEALWQDRIGITDLVLVDSSFSTTRQPTQAENVIHRNVLKFFNMISHEPDWHGVRSQLITSSPFVHVDSSHRNASDPDPIEVLSSKDVLLIGGPVTNFYVRSYLNYVPNYPLVVGMTFPEPPNTWIYDQQNDLEYRTTYTNPADRDSDQLIDYGILTICENPFNIRRKLLAVMGLRANMTALLLSMLFQDDGADLLAKKLDAAPLAKDQMGHQFLVSLDYQTGQRDVVTFLVPRRPTWKRPTPNSSK